VSEKVDFIDEALKLNSDKTNELSMVFKRDRAKSDDRSGYRVGL